MACFCFLQKQLRKPELQLSVVDWTDPNTWDCTCVPGNNEDAVIDDGDTVTLTQNDAINDFTVNASGVVEDASFRLTVRGNLVMNGTYNGSGNLRVNGGAGVTVDGSGTMNNNRLQLRDDVTIQSSADFTTVDLRIDSGATATNEGTITVTDDVIGVHSSSTLVNSTNATLNAQDAILNTGTLTATASGNTVNYSKPSGNQNVKVPSSSTYFNLTINSDESNLVGDIIIDGDLTITATGVLDVTTAGNFGISIRGDWSNSGNFRERSGAVTFNGSSAQEINSSSNEDFNDLTIDNSSGVTINASSSNVRIGGTMTVSAGVFTTNDNLVLNSTSTETGRVADLTGGGSFSGSVVMERFLPANSGWHQLSSCISGMTLEDWEDDFVMSGFTGSFAPTFAFVSVYSYDESTLGVLDSGFTAATNITNALGDGGGRWVYIGPNSTNINVRGTLITGSVDLPVTYTDDPGQPATEDGWNLVGNPYPSAINWDAAGWTKSGVNDAIYIWDLTTSQFASYVGGASSNGGTRNIASSQGFWVQTNSGSPILRIAESCKADTLPEFYRLQSPEWELFKIKATGYAIEDETVIRFDKNAHESFDPSMDAYKLFSTNPFAPGLSTDIGAKRDLSINTLAPPINGDIEIPLRFQVGVSGNYNLEFDGARDLKQVSCLFLEDLETGAMIDLKTDTAYSFYIADTTEAVRFLIHASPRAIQAAEDPICHDESTGFISLTGHGLWGYEVMNSAINLNRTDVNLSGQQTLHGLPNGTYTVTITNGFNALCPVITDTVVLDNPTEVFAEFSLSSETLELPYNATVSITNLSTGATGYTWDFGEWAPLVTDSQPTYTFVTPGMHEIILTAMNDEGCIDQVSHEVLVEGIPIGIEEQETNLLQAYSFGKELIIRNLGSEEQGVEMRLINTLGQPAGQERFQLSPDGNKRFSIDHLASGIYLVELRSSNSISVQKVTLQ